VRVSTELPAHVQQRVSADVVQFVMVFKIKYLDRALLHFAEAVWTRLLGTQMKCAAQTLLCQRPSYHLVPLEVNQLFPTNKACPLGERAYDPEEIAELLAQRFELAEVRWKLYSKRYRALYTLSFV